MTEDHDRDLPGWRRRFGSEWSRRNAFPWIAAGCVAFDIGAAWWLFGWSLSGMHEPSPFADDGPAKGLFRMALSAFLMTILLGCQVWLLRRRMYRG